MTAQQQDLSVVLSRLAAALERPTVPVDRALWDANACAAYLVVSYEHFRQRIACRPDFPDAIQLPTEGGRGTRRWKAGEVMAWADKRREKRARD